MVTQRKEVSIHKAIDRIKKAIAEFYSLKKDLLGDEKKKGKGCEKVMEKWRKPEIGWRKINCDGALDLKTKEAGAGVIVRDYKGEVVDGKCRRGMAESPLMAEALAVREGVFLALEKKWQKIEIEIDSRELYNGLIMNYKQMDWRIKPIVLEIQEMLKLVPCWRFNVVHRSANAAADWIAVQTRLGMNMSVWNGHLPLSLVGILDKDGLPAPP